MGICSQGAVRTKLAMDMSLWGPAYLKERSRRPSRIPASCKVRRKDGGATCLSRGKDSLDRVFFLKLSLDKEKDAAIFWIECGIKERNRDGSKISGEGFFVVDFGTLLEEKSRDMSANALWDAHFKACCKFNLLVNNCLCEHLRHVGQGPNYIYGCTHKKACNSTVCFAHLHKNCVDFP